MEGFQNLVLPQTSEHIILLNVLLLLTLIVFTPYIAILWGNLFLGAYCRHKCDENREKANLAEFLISFMKEKRFFGYILSTIPSIGLLTIFMQLLAEAKTSVFPLFIVSSILFLLGQFSYYRFQSSVLKENKNISNSNRFFLFAAITMISLGIWTIFAAYNGIIQVGDFGKQGEIIDYFISFSTISKVIVFFILSIATSSAYGIFRLYFNSEIENDTRKNNIKILAKIALTYIVILPIWATFSFTLLPDYALSPGVFLLIGFSLILTVIMAVYYYGLSDEVDFRMGVNAFIVFIITLSTVFAADHLIIHNSISPATDKLHAKAAILEAEKESVTTVTLSEQEMLTLGEDVYNKICFACHQFDKKLVGPPYNEILPKYADAPEKMKEYILKPVKVREDYPPMPAQPLKPNEADAIVAYLLNRMKTN